MTITIELTPTEEAQLVAAAKQEGMEPGAFLKHLLTAHLPGRAEACFADILAPVHAYSRDLGDTEEEIGAFVDAEVDAYRAERRARRKAEAGQ